MQGKTHLTIGAAAGLSSAIVTTNNGDWQTLAVGTALGGLAGLVPDWLQINIPGASGLLLLVVDCAHSDVGRSSVVGVCYLVGAVQMALTHPAGQSGERRAGVLAVWPVDAGLIVLVVLTVMGYTGE